MFAGRPDLLLEKKKVDGLDIELEKLLSERNSKPLVTVWFQGAERDDDRLPLPHRTKGKEHETRSRS